MCLLTAFSEREQVGFQFMYVGYKMIRNKDDKPYDGRLGQYPFDELIVDKPNILFKNGLYTELSKNGRMEVKCGQANYPLGFHIFLSKDDCFKYYLPGDWNVEEKRITRVLYNDIVAIGFNGTNHYERIETESKGLCVVARQLFIKNDDWKQAVPCI